MSGLLPAQIWPLPTLQTKGLDLWLQTRRLGFPGAAWTRVPLTGAGTILSFSCAADIDEAPRAHTQGTAVCRNPQTNLGLCGEGPGGHCFPRGSENGLAQAAGCPRELKGVSQPRASTSHWEPDSPGPRRSAGSPAHSCALSSGPVKAGLFPAKERSILGPPLPQ